MRLYGEPCGTVYFAQVEPFSKMKSQREKAIVKGLPIEINKTIMVKFSLYNPDRI